MNRHDRTASREPTAARCGVGGCGSCARPAMARPRVSGDPSPLRIMRAHAFFFPAPCSSPLVAALEPVVLAPTARICAAPRRRSALSARARATGDQQSKAGVTRGEPDDGEDGGNEQQQRGGRGEETLPASKSDGGPRMEGMARTDLAARRWRDKDVRGTQAAVLRPAARPRYRAHGSPTWIQRGAPFRSPLWLCAATRPCAVPCCAPPLRRSLCCVVECAPDHCASTPRARRSGGGAAVTTTGLLCTRRVWHALRAVPPLCSEGRTKRIDERLSHSVGSATVHSACDPV